MRYLLQLVKKCLKSLCLLMLIIMTSQVMAYPTQVTVKNEGWYGIHRDITIYGYEHPSHWMSCGNTGELAPGRSGVIYCSKGVQMLTDESMLYQQADGCKTEDLAKYSGDVVALVTPGVTYGFYCKLQPK